MALNQVQVDTLIVVSTFNRLDLTGMTLDSIARNKTSQADVLILDDRSTEYDQAWLSQWGWPVKQPEEHLGVGAMARWRYEAFLDATDYDYEWFCALDNDVALCAQFDLNLRFMVENTENHWSAAGKLLVASGYRSVTQTVVDRMPLGCVMDGIGGVNHFCRKDSVREVLRRMEPKDWGHTWDGSISRCIDLIVTPYHSWIQHRGVYGNGVNGPSPDVAVSFVGEGW